MKKSKKFINEGRKGGKNLYRLAEYLNELCGTVDEIDRLHYKEYIKSFYKEVDSLIEKGHDVDVIYGEPFDHFTPIFKIIVDGEECYECEEFFYAENCTCGYEDESAESFCDPDYLEYFQRCMERDD